MALTNSQFEKIKKIYDDRQLARHYESEKRLAYVNEHIVGFKELNDRLSSLCIKQAKLLLDGQASALTDLKQSIASLKEQKSALLKQAGFPADYLQVPYVCKDCQDTGYIDGEKCPCFKQAALSILYDQSHLQKQLDQMDFSKVSDVYYDGEDLVNFKDSYEKSTNFVNTFSNDYQNLCFYGTVGTGKSFLSGCIAKALMKEGYSVIYFSASRLMDLFSYSAFDYKGREEAEDIFKDIYECDLLIIDDLGSEVTNALSASRLFTCLNERYLRKKSVIISTNLSLGEIRTRYSDRIFSRISNYFKFCRMTGPDIRTL